MINPILIEQELEKVKNARRLGGFDKTCVICSEPDQNVLELHHLSGEDYGDDVYPVCRNCHRKLTNKRANKPAPEYPSQLDQIGHWLIGLAQLLLELAKKAFEFGSVLIESAKVIPSPYGYALEATC